MVVRSLLLLALIGALVIVSVLFARPLLGLPSGTPSARPTTSASATATLAASVSPTASLPPSATPTRTPTASCPPVAPGGGPRSHALADVRVAAFGDADRVVFDFGPGASADDAVPAFTIERAVRFTNIAGQEVPVQGTAFWAVRFEGSDAHTAYAGPRDIQPGLTVVRNVKLVEDFEAVLIWAVGLSRLECPQVTTQRSPLRLVLDFPRGS